MQRVAVQRNPSLGLVAAVEHHRRAAFRGWREPLVGEFLAGVVERFADAVAEGGARFGI